MSLEVEHKPLKKAPYVPVIALDGPTASGKGTVASRLARILGFHVLDSGLLYRVLALAAQHHGVALHDEHSLEVLAGHLDVQFLVDSKGENLVVLEGEDVSRTLREEKTGLAASMVAVLPQVRAALLQRQIAFRESPGLVADGRDMGTVVFPDAEVKVFITASAEARADRRYRQLNDSGIHASLADLIEDIRQRDVRDTQRAVAPLRPAKDAVELDTTLMTVQDAVDAVLALVARNERLVRFLPTQLHP